MPAYRKPRSTKPGKPRRPLGCVETAAFLALAALVLGSFVVPPALFRLSYGRGPVEDAALKKVEAGMTAEEVIAAVGPPHKKHREDERERWIYFKDSFGWGSTEVRFDTQGRVEGVWTDK